MVHRAHHPPSVQDSHGFRFKPLHNLDRPFTNAVPQHLAYCRPWCLERRVGQDVSLLVVDMPAVLCADGTAAVQFPKNLQPREAFISPAYALDVVQESLNPLCHFLSELFGEEKVGAEVDIHGRTTL